MRKENRFTGDAAQMMGIGSGKESEESKSQSSSPGSERVVRPSDESVKRLMGVFLDKDKASEGSEFDDEGKTVEAKRTKPMLEVVEPGEGAPVAVVDNEPVDTSGEKLRGVKEAARKVKEVMDKTSVDEIVLGAAAAEVIDVVQEKLRGRKEFRDPGEEVGMQVREYVKKPGEVRYRVLPKEEKEFLKDMGRGDLVDEYDRLVEAEKNAGSEEERKALTEKRADKAAESWDRMALALEKQGKVMPGKLVEGDYPQDVQNYLDVLDSNLRTIHFDAGRTLEQRNEDKANEIARAIGALQAEGINDPELLNDLRRWGEWWRGRDFGEKEGGLMSGERQCGSCGVARNNVCSYGCFSCGAENENYLNKDEFKAVLEKADDLFSEERMREYDPEVRDLAEEANSLIDENLPLNERTIDRLREIYERSKREGKGKRGVEDLQMTLLATLRVAREVGIKRGGGTTSEGTLLKDIWELVEMPQGEEEWRAWYVGHMLEVFADLQDKDRHKPFTLNEFYASLDFSVPEKGMAAKQGLLLLAENGSRFGVNNPKELAKELEEMTQVLLEMHNNSMLLFKNRRIYSKIVELRSGKAEGVDWYEVVPESFDLLSRSFLGESIADAIGWHMKLGVTVYNSEDLFGGSVVEIAKKDPDWLRVDKGDVDENGNRVWNHFYRIAGVERKNMYSDGVSAFEARRIRSAIRAEMLFKEDQKRRGVGDIITINEAVRKGRDLDEILRSLEIYQMNADELERVINDVSEIRHIRSVASRVELAERYALSWMYQESYAAAFNRTLFAGNDMGDASGRLYWLSDYLISKDVFPRETRVWYQQYNLGDISLAPRLHDMKGLGEVPLKGGKPKDLEQLLGLFWQGRWHEVAWPSVQEAWDILETSNRSNENQPTKGSGLMDFGIGQAGAVLGVLDADPDGKNLDPGSLAALSVNLWLAMKDHEAGVAYQEAEEEHKKGKKGLFGKRRAKPSRIDSERLRMFGFVWFYTTMKHWKVTMSDSGRPVSDEDIFNKINIAQRVGILYDDKYRGFENTYEKAIDLLLGGGPLVDVRVNTERIRRGRKSAGVIDWVLEGAARLSRIGK